MVVFLFVRNSQHVEYLGKDALISVHFNEGIIISRLLMEIWACTEDIAAGRPINHRLKICFDRLKGYNLLM